jgi:hypothetical protein
MTPMYYGCASFVTIVLSMSDEKSFSVTDSGKARLITSLTSGLCPAHRHQLFHSSIVLSINDGTSFSATEVDLMEGRVIGRGD